MEDFSNSIEVIHNGNDRVMITFGGQGLELTIDEAAYIFTHLGYALQDLNYLDKDTDAGVGG